jgi:lysylphosphatidylglycerol synthetase-like protein (DUF2156 family)
VKGIFDFVVDLMPRLAVVAVFGILGALFSRLRLIAQAKFSICFNLLHLACSLVYRRELPMGDRAAFPAWVRWVLVAELLCVAAVVSGVLLRVCKPDDEGGTWDEIEKAAQARRVSADDWGWMAATVISFAGCAAIIFSLS